MHGEGSWPRSSRTIRRVKKGLKSPKMDRGRVVDDEVEGQSNPAERRGEQLSLVIATNRLKLGKARIVRVTKPGGPK